MSLGRNLRADLPPDLATAGLRRRTLMIPLADLAYALNHAMRSSSERRGRQAETVSNLRDHLHDLRR